MNFSDQGPKGTTGHYGSDGRSPVDRISVYTKYTGAGENLSYSDIKHPEDPVLQLIIDDGVPSRGHRANILKTDYTHLGVSCGCHKEYGEMCCFNYGTNITPKNPDLIAFAAPQLKTCSAYTASTPDATTGNVVLTPLTPVFAATEAPSTGSTGIFEIIGTTGSTEPAGSTVTTGSTETTGSITTPSESAITYSVSTSIDSDEIITKVYTINQTSAEGTTTYEFTWMGYDEADAPSIDDVLGYFGIS